MAGMNENPYKAPVDNAGQAKGHENRIVSLLFSFSVRSLIASLFLGLAGICGFYAAFAALFAALSPQAKSFWPDVYISAISLANAAAFSITAWAIWS